MALARADAGVDIELDPTTMVQAGRKLAPGQVVRPWAHGTFSRAHEVPGLPRSGEIWVCKLGWWTGAPWDVLAYARNHPSYPCDSTLEQLYDATEFEAYRELGVTTVRAAAKQCAPPLQWTAPVPFVPAEGASVPAGGASVPTGGGSPGEAG
jgi:hypothetical protein